MASSLNVRAIELPLRMRGLPKDHRGYPVPVNVFRDTDGRPHFTINDEHVRQRLIRGDACAICGQSLLRGRWFVGGPLSAFHPQGAYLDTPMHEECCGYAMRACPYLATQSFTKRIDSKTLDPDKAGGALVLVDPTMIPNRPDPFVAVMCTAQALTTLPGSDFVRYLRPKRPYLRAKFWRDGVQLRFAEGLAAVLEKEAPTLAPLGIGQAELLALIRYQD